MTSSRRVCLRKGLLILFFIVNCRYQYASTVTCAGHAALFTGACPNFTGIIANHWYDLVLHRSVYCATDSGTELVGGTGIRSSPRNLIGTTLGDEMRMASDFKSKVVAVSLKDRSAVMPGEVCEVKIRNTRETSLHHLRCRAGLWGGGWLLAGWCPA